jgi:hypothetical protein
MSDNQWLTVIALVLVTCLGVSLYRPQISAIETCAAELNKGLTVRQKGALYGDGVPYPYRGYRDALELCSELGAQEARSRALEVVATVPRF